MVPAHVPRAAPPCCAAPPGAEPHCPAEPRRPTEPHCPARAAPAATTASAATAATAATAAMASPNVLTFDVEGRAVDFDVWVDDLQLFLQCDSKDGVSLFDHTSGISPAPSATYDSTVRSQWTTRDAVARLAVRSHLPSVERAHFGQYKTAKSLYDAVVVRYSSPATAAVPLVGFAAACRLDYAASLVAESESASVCPPSVGGECALGTDVLEDRQEEFECFAAALPHLVSMLLTPEGDPDAPDIPTPRSYAEAIEGTHHYFHTFSPTPKMTTLRVLLHVAAQRDYELHSLDFSTTFLQGSLHEEIWLRRPPGFTGSFPAGTQWSLRRPVYGLRQAPREWHDTLRMTLAALGFAPSTAGPSLFLRNDATLPPFYVLVYVDDLVFATADTEALAHVKSELQKRHSCTDLAPPSDESVEPSGPYPELVGCLMYKMTCTRPDLAYPLSILARYVTPGGHKNEHMDAAKRVLRYLCITSGMGLVLGGRAQVVLTGHADASWADDLTTQRSSQGCTFSLGSGSVSWRSTRSSSVLSSSCEAEIYAGALAAQELRWLTYLLTVLGEPPRSPPVLYVDNKAMIALCQEHRLEHRLAMSTNIALRYFLARELQQCGQLRLAYVATRANTADVFTKAL
ncbi:unnamed protein product [Closterium sp. NIES-54]